ncbi:hypothetical protein [Pseudomonas benzenivorans]|uniref:Uncharacterized protein n=1 Tax=Pseudomonas benzenivorans TaxID=556533 RepID=A0ABY5H841_9PSED|nr:hypothetical protein [Pseudomonas benzenivorans]UTW07206.1 hypothetical protein KDW96_18870 [Pseudomonas benzenivorans]
MDDQSKTQHDKPAAGDLCDEDAEYLNIPMVNREGAALPKPSLGSRLSAWRRKLESRDGPLR